MENDPATEILAATHRAICQHGYANLTIEAIAEEADRSKASIHYYYASKETLVIEFLDYLYERYTARLPSTDRGTPRDQLFAHLETVRTTEDAASGQEIQTALLELRAQAPYNDAIQTRLSEFDAVLFERLRGIIATGVEMGEFTATVEPAVAAEFLVTVITGAQTRRVATEESAEQLDEVLTRYVESYLLPAELSEVTH
jgi:AcrR family transcriptional regulator